jgi:HSP20 family protein
MELDRRNNQRSNGNQTGTQERGLGLPAMFDDFITRDFFKPSFSNTGVSTPAVNIIETDEDFRLEMVAPGMKKENFSVEFQNDVLRISYEHDDNREGERRGSKYTTHEYNYHSFSRSFSLPATVDAEKIQANYVDGILNLIIPKKEEAKRKPAKQIKIM